MYKFLNEKGEEIMTDYNQSRTLPLNIEQFSHIETSTVGFATSYFTIYINNTYY